MESDECNRTIAQERVFDCGELADFLGVQKSTINRWRRQGRGPAAIKLGDAKSAPIRYRLSDVNRWARQPTQGSVVVNTDSVWLVRHVAERLKVHPRTVRRRLDELGEEAESMAPLSQLVAALGVSRPEVFLNVLKSRDEVWSVDHLAFFMERGRRAVFEHMRLGKISPLIRRGGVLRFSMNESVEKERRSGL